MHEQTVVYLPAEEVVYIDANTSENIELTRGTTYEVVRTYVSTNDEGDTRLTLAVTE